jgi:hypothetical protein
LINASMLTMALSAQVRAVEADLRQDKESAARLRADWEEARKAEQTAADFESGWLPERVTLAASAWVLATVLVRFCEDNLLIDVPSIAGPAERLGLARDRQEAYVRRHPASSDREWIIAAVESLSVSTGTMSMFDPLHRLMDRCPLSPEAARELLAFWRRPDPAGRLAFDFTDGHLDTRFLGDLYQGLSETARDRYALLQTPEFIEEFILDRTLGPAIEEFGLEPEPAPASAHGVLPRRLRFIDPACGSGGFVLGAFRRLLAAWEGERPGAGRAALVVTALESIHGVDKNPVAAVICRFRLLTAAMRTAGWRRIAEVPALPFAIVADDSLAPGGFVSRDSSVLGLDNAPWDPVNLADPPTSVLRLGSYHAVATNPPYITVRDRAEAAAYRALYPQCRGMFSLVVPFIVRCFQLARRGSQAGFVGTIVANSFMNRDFGRQLVEDFLPKVDLTHVIDTSGAYIPGHGAPTLILLGRARRPEEATVRAVLGVRGEPAYPDDPARGLVWQAITGQADRPGSEGEWVSVADLDRGRLARHPWNLSGGGGDDLVERMASGRRTVRDVTAHVGIYGSTGADEAFIAPDGAFRRLGTEAEATVDVITGSDVRDWGATAEYCAFSPGRAVRDSGLVRLACHHRRLWPVRTLLRDRLFFGKTMNDLGLPWYSWHQLAAAQPSQSRAIVFSRVATHPHFAILLDGFAPLQSAPVIWLGDTASEDDLLGLAGLLNSSAACFWLRYHSPAKAAPTPDQLRAEEEWGRIHEFGASHVQKLPLPDRLPATVSERLDRLAGRLRAVLPGAGEAGEGRWVPTDEGLRQARAEWERLRRQMIAWQEELDWDVYHRYGLLTCEEAAGLVADPAVVGELHLGERAFEILLARRMRDDGFQTQWFTRHRSVPVTEIPAHWPDEYRAVVERRIAVIEQNPAIALIERPEHKRRWAIEPWDDIETAALTAWLLDQCEDRALWHGPDGAPRPLTVHQLAGRLRADRDAVSVARLLHDDPDADLSDVLAGILADEHVPYLAQFRYRPEGIAKRLAWERTWNLQRQEDATGEQLDIQVPPKYRSGDFRKLSYWRHRGSLDMQKERFISYPDAGSDGDKSLLLGWAGWDHKEQSLALVGLIEERTTADGWSRDRIVPLLAGLAEVIPWVRQWHSEADPALGQSIANVLDDYLATQLDRYQLTADTLSSWTAPPVRRGRPSKRRLRGR